MSCRKICIASSIRSACGLAVKGTGWRGNFLIPLVPRKPSGLGEHQGDLYRYYFRSLYHSSNSFEPAFYWQNDIRLSSCHELTNQISLAIKENTHKYKYASGYYKSMRNKGLICTCDRVICYWIPFGQTRRHVHRSNKVQHAFL